MLDDTLKFTVSVCDVTGLQILYLSLLPGLCISNNFLRSAYLAVIAQVRFVMKDSIRKQLDLGNIVLLSNLGERIMKGSSLSFRRQPLGGY